MKFYIIDVDIRNKNLVRYDALTQWKDGSYSCNIDIDNMVVVDIAVVELAVVDTTADLDRYDALTQWKKSINEGVSNVNKISTCVFNQSSVCLIIIIIIIYSDIS